MLEGSNEFSVRAVAFVRSVRQEIKYDYWGGVVSEIELDSRLFTEESVRGIEAFSHLEVIFVLDRIPSSEIVTGALHPRNRADLPKMGIFATRMVNRPNRLGLSRCELLACKGLTLTVRGLDAIDGTPVADIKPYMREFAPRGDVRQPSWMSELLAEYFKT